MNEHKRFEMLCALATVGQVSDADLRELKRHLEGCGDCQERLSEFAQITAQALALSGEGYSRPRSPKAMTERFVERARAQGIAMRVQERWLLNNWSLGIGWKVTAAAALLLFAVIAGSISRSFHWRASAVDTATAKVESPGEPSIERRVSEDHFERARTNRSSTLRQAEKLRSRISRAARVATRTNSAPETIFRGIESPARHYHGQILFQGLQLFSSDLTNAQAKIFPTSDRATTAFAVMSLNFPPHIVSFGSERRFQKDWLSDGSELVPNIDWYQVWRAHTEGLRNSNDGSQSRRRTLAPVWPFSRESGEEDVR